MTPLAATALPSYLRLGCAHRSSSKEATDEKSMTEHACKTVQTEGFAKPGDNVVVQEFPRPAGND